MDFEYNKDWKLRDSMLNDVYGNKQGTYDIFRFDGVTAETLQKLVDLKFADPDEYQNEAPSVGEILDFLNENPDFTAHGYAVTVRRDDYRIILEGVEGNSRDFDQISRFMNMFRFADEFETGIGYQRAWFD